MSFISFTQYQPPGVYVQQVASPIVSVNGLSPNVVGIVGPAQGFKTVTESYLLTSTTPVFLNNYGAILNSIIVADSSGNSFLTSDYNITQFSPGQVGYNVNLGGNNVSSLIGNTGTGPAYNQTTLAAVSGGNIVSGSVVYVTYQYQDFNYFLPSTYTNPNNIIADFGVAFDPITGNIDSPITLAAQLAFGNGASTVVVCPTTDTSTASRTGLTNAYTSIGAFGTVDLLVPLPVGMGNDQISEVGTDLATFLNSEQALSNFILGFLGSDNTITLGPDTIANTIANDRVVEAWPNQMNYFNQILGQTVNVSGYYLAAALAGVVSSGQPQTPLTRKLVSGFSGIPQTVLSTMTLPYKNQLSSAGVSVVEPTLSGNGIWVRQGVTTSTTSQSTMEISLIREGDAIIELIQSSLNDAGIIGSAFEATSISLITSIIQACLNSLVDQGVIVSFDSLSVIQQGTNPVIALVTFNYTPAYPLNYVLVQFGVDTSSGITSPTSTSTTSVGS